jgi:hypothetical protein
MTNGGGAGIFGALNIPPINNPYNIAKTIMSTATTAQVVLCSLMICGI